MSKTITSPIKRFPGTVELPDYYTWGDLIKWDEQVGKWGADGIDSLHELKIQSDTVLMFVSAWHIEGLPEHPTTLPANPVKSCVMLVKWLIGEISKTINEDEEVDPFLLGESGTG